MSSSAYTEAYNVCSVAAAPVSDSATEEDQGRTSEEEGCNADSSYIRQVHFNMFRLFLKGKSKCLEAYNVWHPATKHRKYKSQKSKHAGIFTSQSPLSSPWLVVLRNSLIILLQSMKSEMRAILDPKQPSTLMVLHYVQLTCQNHSSQFHPHFIHGVLFMGYTGSKGGIARGWSRAGGSRLNWSKKKKSGVSELLSPRATLKMKTMGNYLCFGANFYNISALEKNNWVSF